MKSPVGETKIRCQNIKKIKKIGYKPEVDINKGLNNTVNWYMDLKRI